MTTATTTVEQVERYAVQRIDDMKRTLEWMRTSNGYLREISNGSDTHTARKCAEASLRDFNRLTGGMCASVNGMRRDAEKHRDSSVLQQCVEEGYEIVRELSHVKEENGKLVHAARWAHTRTLIEQAKRDGTDIKINF